MDKQFFQLRKHWIVALITIAALTLTLILKDHQYTILNWIFLISILTLFVQFVWSGAYAIAALLSGNSSYFFTLTLLCIFELAALSAGILIYLTERSTS